MEVLRWFHRILSSRASIPSNGVIRYSISLRLFNDPLYRLRFYIKLFITDVWIVRLARFLRVDDFDCHWYSVCVSIVEITPGILKNFGIGRLIVVLNCYFLAFDFVLSAGYNGVCIVEKYSRWPNNRC